MTAIEHFKQGGCYVCPQSLHELALLMDWEERINGRCDVGMIFFTHKKEIKSRYWLVHHLCGEDITEEFFEEVCGV